MNCQAIVLGLEFTGDPGMKTGTLRRESACTIRVLRGLAVQRFCTADDF